MKYSTILYLIIFLFSCSREEHFKNFIPERDVKFSGSNTGTFTASINQFTDTIKYSKYKEWTKKISFVSVDGLKSIRVFNQSKVMIAEYPIDLNIKDYNIIVPVLSTGLINYKIEFLETNGKSNFVDLLIYSFDNWLSVANINYNIAEKKLDFSKSFDLDQRFGGKIDEFRVSVNGFVRKQDESNYFLATINNGFTVGQTYMIKLETIDNDGVASSTEQNITIN